MSKIIALMVGTLALTGCGLMAPLAYNESQCLSCYGGVKPTPVVIIKRR